MNKIGIDAGGSLIKIVYTEQGKKHYKTFSSGEMEKVIEWLQWLSPESEYSITGGRASSLARFLTHSTSIPEFEAVSKGAGLLWQEQHQASEPFILANIGTGTSLFWIDPEKGDYRRLTGTGLGGGTIMGLGKILSGKSPYTEILELAEKGNREEVDLLVKDLYGTEEPPVPGHLTAANFAGDFDEGVRVEDSLRSMINMVAENIILLAAHHLELADNKTIVFAGGALSGNRLLKNDLAQFQDILGYDAVFLEKGAYAGAIGCLNSI